MSGGGLFNSFEDEELDSSETTDEPTGDVLDELDDEQVEAQQADEQLDEDMSEAESRINLAGYYKQLAKGGIFDDASVEAGVVDAEVRSFARERMKTLLNLSSEKPKVEIFTEAQIDQHRNHQGGLERIQNIAALRK